MSWTLAIEIDSRKIVCKNRHGYYNYYLSWKTGFYLIPSINQISGGLFNEKKMKQ